MQYFLVGGGGRSLCVIAILGTLKVPHRYGVGMRNTRERLVQCPRGTLFHQELAQEIYFLTENIISKHSFDQDNNL